MALTKPIMPRDPPPAIFVAMAENPAAAFILMMFVLVTSLTARYLLARSERKLRGG